MSSSAAPPISLEATACFLCGTRDADPIAVGEDFEYRSCPEQFVAMRCRRCTHVYLDPRPTAAAMAQIYPDSYHAFEFSGEQFGLVHSVRSRLEARRLLKAAAGLPANARVLDVGCGDGFHLDLLRQHGPKGWTLLGADLDERAIAAGRARGLDVRLGTVQDLDEPDGSIDMALCIQTIEHVLDPADVLASIGRLLRPGGRLLVVTDDSRAPDARLFRRRYWGGYHFPRHLNLFNARTLTMAGERAGLRVRSMGTMVSPVNWTYSVRNGLDDSGAPRWLVNRFSLSSAPALGVFTVVDGALNLFGKGALLRAVFERPEVTP